MNEQSSGMHSLHLTQDTHTHIRGEILPCRCAWARHSGPSSKVIGAVVAVAVIAREGAHALAAALRRQLPGICETDTSHSHAQPRPQPSCLTTGEQRGSRAGLVWCALRMVSSEKRCGAAMCRDGRCANAGSAAFFLPLSAGRLRNKTHRSAGVDGTVGQSGNAGLLSGGEGWWQSAMQAC